LTVISVTEKDIREILLKHPWLPCEYAKRMAEDLKRKNCRTPEANRIYQGEAKRLEELKQKSKLLMLRGFISGKYLDRRGSSRKLNC